MSEVWYKERCPDCDITNWINNGDESDSDLSKVDIEGIKCFHCGLVFCLAGDSTAEYLKDFGYDSIEDINYEVGKEVPE